MAMDYLAIQGSAVPCKQVFSSSSETDTKKRNRIQPPLMEALQILKFNRKKHQLNFMGGLLFNKEELDEDESDLLGMFPGGDQKCLQLSLEDVLKILGKTDIPESPSEDSSESEYRDEDPIVGENNGSKTDAEDIT